MKINFAQATVYSVLVASFLTSAVSAQTQPVSRAEKKGQALEQGSQKEANKAQQQEAAGHPLRAGRDAKKSAREGARAERKFKKAGNPAPAAPVQ